MRHSFFHSHVAKRLAFAFVCLSLLSAAHSQVNVIDKPYRPAGGTAGAPDLAIQPNTPSPSVPAPQVVPQPPPTRLTPVITQMLVNQSIPTVAAPAAPQSAVAPVQRWEVLTEDQKLSRTIARWARKEMLDTFYEAPKDLVAVKANYTGTFAEAVTQLMLDTPSSGYPLRACQYDNSIRILHLSQSCKR